MRWRAKQEACAYLIPAAQLSSFQVPFTFENFVLTCSGRSVRESKVMMGYSISTSALKLRAESAHSLKH